MALLGRNCSVLINGTGIIADSVSLSQSNNILPLYGVGFNGINNSSISGPKLNKLSISYLPDSIESINFRIISGNKTNYVTSGVNINFAGLTGLYYLESLAFDLQPNQTVSISTNYINFDNITGNFTGAIYNPTGYLYRNYNGFSCSIPNSNRPVLSLAYNYQMDLEPVYKIGSKTPFGVVLNNGAETFDITLDNWTGLNFYGSGIQEIVNNTPILNMVNVSPISGSGLFTFDLSQCRLTEVNTDADTQDIAKTTYKFINYL
jgi:hypothetical protein